MIDGDEKLPKGMEKMPAEFKESDELNIEEAVTHMDINYSGMVRKAIKSLEKEGIDAAIKKAEILEEEGNVTIMSLLIEVRNK